jgi:hypothetical protein
MDQSSHIEAMVVPNGHLVGRLSEQERDRWLARARGFVVASDEDFGIASPDCGALSQDAVAQAPR